MLVSGERDPDVLRRFQRDLQALLREDPEFARTLEPIIGNASADDQVDGDTVDDVAQSDRAPTPAGDADV
jgi:hypothetical protein